MNAPLLRGLLLLAMAVPGAATALDYQFHGFAAQGFALSEGNNAFGDSDDGSFDFYEAGVNATVDAGNGLLGSAQVLVRRAGEVDRGGLRLDYALLDWRFLRGSALEAGVRAGRVKNPFGLFNETRDVVFTRPGIVLPSLYFDAEGTRSLLFSSDGAQLYGGWELGETYLSAVVSRAANQTLDEDQKRGFGGTVTLPNHIHLDGLTFARLMAEGDGGIWRTALTYTTAEFVVDAAAESPITADFDFDLFVLSGSYAAARYTLTSEYQVTHSRGQSNLMPDTDQWSDSLYVQGDYRISPAWTTMLRYDLAFQDRGDRDGREFAAATGQPRHGTYSRDLVLGAHWRHGSHWGIWGELHVIDGSGSVSDLDNAGRTQESRWNLFLLMAGYRF